MCFSAEIPGAHGSRWPTVPAPAVKFIASVVSSIGARALVLPRRSKQTILLVGDVASLALALWAAFAFRLETIDVPVGRLFPYLLAAPLIALPIFSLLGLYRSVVRYMGLPVLLAIFKATGIYAATLVCVIYLFDLPDVTYALALLHGALTALLIGASRAFAQHCLSTAYENPRHRDDHGKRVIVYGAGSAGAQLTSALAHSRELIAVAMVDDNPALHHKRIGVLEVHPPSELAALIRRHDATEVLIALPSAPRARRSEIIAGLESLPVQVRTLPGVAEIAEGKVKTTDLREVEIEDLLWRDPIAPDPALMSANISGKAVMVTGAGGSIGSELCRQIIARRPASLVLYELNEFALYSIEQALIATAQTLPDCPTRIWPILGSVCEAARLERTIRHYGIQTLYHAAAFKHVPMVEKNPCEGIRNNVLGTWHAARAALAAGAEAFVLISTDKAVRPTNVMGASKRLAEMILQALAAAYPTGTRYTMVRFGNVLGSSGSVVPLFREQIKHGGPVTVTDPRIIRYFMTIPEAAQLVIQAGAMGSDGDVFVLDMGKPVKILDMARRMVHLSGLSVRDDDHPEGDIEIVFTGLRPGEKLYEELLIGDNVSTTAHPRIHQANEKMLPLASIEALVERLERACDNDDSDLARAVLLEAVEEFSPQCSNQDLLGGVREP
ncbi:MAG: polysaccharide biosynthesis protein [Rhodocyclales bacterium]|nr:polysaccharide biosynthesis protein [Rhodocyclales bacterium]